MRPPPLAPPAPLSTTQQQSATLAGATLLDTGTPVPDGSGQTLTYPGQSGQDYLVRVLPGPAAAAGGVR